MYLSHFIELVYAYDSSVCEHHGAGLQAALDWLEKNQDDPNIDKEDVEVAVEPATLPGGISAEGA